MKNWKSAGLTLTPLAIIIAIAVTIFVNEMLFMTLLHEYLVPTFKFSGSTWDVIDAVTLVVVVTPLLYFLVFRRMHESEKRFRQVNATAPNAIVIVNNQGQITDWNLAAQKMFQYSPEEAVGQHMHHLIAPPRYRDDAERGFAHFEEVGDGPLIGKITEISALRKDGSEFPIELSIAAVKLKGHWHAIGIMHDITERKQAEQVLHESEARFRALADVAGDLIFTVAADGEVGYVNEMAARALHTVPEQVVGKRLRDLFPPETFEQQWRNLQKVFESGKPLYVEGLTRFPHGEVWQSTWLTPLRDASGSIVTVLGASRDLTERKQMETALQESEIKYRLLTENSTDCIFWVGLDGRYKYVSPASLNVSGYAPEEFLADPELATRIVHPDDRAAYLAHLEQAKGVDEIEMIFRIARRDGEQRWIGHHCQPLLDDAGNYLGRRGINRDVTERKLAEQVLRDERDFSQAIISTAQAIVLALDTEGRIVSFNPYLENLSGWRLEEVRGKDWFSTFLPERNREATRKLFQTAIGGIQTRGNVDALLTRDGRELLIEWYDKALKDSEGKVTGLLAVGQDVSERKQHENEMQEMLTAANQSRQVMLAVVEDQRRAEESLRQLNEILENKVLARTADLDKARLEAEQANQAKSAFLATMSHEIRTPMNGVIGMIDVLQQSSLNSSQMESANIIHDSAFALLGIINDILDFSKIEAGKLQIDSVPMSIVEVVEAACETIDHMALKKNVELTLFSDPAIPAAVIGDPGRLRQILINLANNAIKFSSGQDRQGKVSVRAVLVEDTPEQILLEFRILDNGIGIDEATQARLFTAFTQADVSTTRAYGGTGLGLAISGQLVNIMGGEITVKSEPGKGSLFSVRLSFALPTGKPATDEASSLVAELPCLVVGGTEGIADDLAAYLAHGGARVERMADLAAIKEWIAARPPGLCIVVIDTAGSKPPLVTSLVDGLRAAARAHPGQETRFVVIGRGQRREPRLEGVDLVAVDGNALTRRTLLKAVAIAAGRAKAPDRETLPGDVKAKLTPLSREEARRRGSLILVAEDNEINQKVILKQLALLGRTADIANNGREALELWQSGDYAMLFADLHMPEMDGYELTAAIRAAEKTDASGTNKPRIPIIAFTANALKGEEEHCLAIGMDDYLSKPVQLVNLKATLGKWMSVAAAEPMPAETTSTKTAPPSPPTVGTPVAVDVNVLKALVGDDEEIIRDFLHDFRISAAKTAVELRTACAAGQAAAAGALAHKLKSSARSVGALALGELCAGMEQAGKAGDMKALAALLPKFEQALASVEGFLEGY